MPTKVKIEELSATCFSVTVAGQELLLSHEQAGAVLYALRGFQSRGIRVVSVEAEVYEDTRTPFPFPGGSMPRAKPSDTRSLWRRFLDWLDGE